MIDIKGPQKKVGVVAPLFDRLVDLEPHIPSEPTPWGYLSKEEYKLSIKKELEALLNTRLPRPYSLGDVSSEQENAVSPQLAYGMPADYGLQDTIAFDGMSKSAWTQIGATFEAAILRFEPRLRHPRVQVDSYDNATQKLTLMVSGAVQLDEQIERVFFPVTLAR